MSDEVDGKLRRAVNKLAKWRAAFAGWQLGTRAMTDPESQAVRDHRELSMILRAEVNALVTVLADNHVITPREEFARQLIEECEHLDTVYQRKFPGFKSTDDGLSIDPATARHTTQGWRP